MFAGIYKRGYNVKNSSTELPHDKRLNKLKCSQTTVLRFTYSDGRKYE